MKIRNERDTRGVLLCVGCPTNNCIGLGQKPIVLVMGGRLKECAWN